MANQAKNPSEHSEVAQCSVNGLPICRRMLNMNLALGYAEEFYSLKALAQKHNKSMEDMFEFAYDYVESRDCFSKEWAKMTNADECPLPSECLINECFQS